MLSIIGLRCDHRFMPPQACGLAKGEKVTTAVELLVMRVNTVRGVFCVKVFQIDHDVKI